MQEQMEALRLRFLERLREEQSLLGSEPLTDAAVAVHRLAGAAGVFGYAELGRRALAVDQALQSGTPPAALDIAALAQEIERVLTHG